MLYKEAGVDIEAADSFIRKIKPLIKKTERPQVLSQIGHYAGLFALNGSYQQPVLCASTDGVGTKLKLALQANKLAGLGQDLVAMSANDVLCLGAKPLFFLDYYATGKLKPTQAATLLKGIAKACASIHCTLLGGETAEMPSLYRGQDFDLAGFLVGIVERNKIIDGSAIQAGDTLIGVASSGPHANGFSLIRKIIRDQRLSLGRCYSLSRPLGETLLTPTRLYGNAVLKLVQEFPIHGIAHLTGGGFWNIPRILPPHCSAVIRLNSWKRPPIFQLLQQWGKIPEREMQRVFNLGIGLVLVVKSGEAEAVIRRLRKAGEEAWVIGSVQKGQGLRVS